MNIQDKIDLTLLKLCNLSFFSFFLFWGYYLSKTYFSELSYYPILSGLSAGGIGLLISLTLSAYIISKVNE